MDEGIDDDPAFHLLTEPDEKWEALPMWKRREIGETLLRAFYSARMQARLQTLPQVFYAVVQRFLQRQDMINNQFARNDPDYKFLARGDVPWHDFDNMGMAMDEVIEILHFCGLTDVVEEAFEIDGVNFWRTVPSQSDLYNVVPRAVKSTVADFTRPHAAS